MSVSYTCPNPDCGVNIKSPARVPAGKSVKCPKCGKPFVPESAEAAPAGGTFKLADDDAPKKPAKPGAAAAAKEAPKKEPAAAEKKSPFADDDDESAESVKKGYGVIEETEEEKKEAEKRKPTFTEVQDKFKKSARGPAQALLVMPSNLLTGEGLVTIVAGALLFLSGMWPLVFNDAPPGEEELDEAIIYMLLGLVTVTWGGLVCFGASHMHELGSYPWAMAGSIMGVAPLLVGIFGIVMLQNPKVKAGFEEDTGGPDDDDEDDDEDDEKEKDEDEDDEEDEEDDDEDDEDEDEDEKAKRKKKAGGKAGKKVAKKAGRDEDDE